MKKLIRIVIMLSVLNIAYAAPPTLYGLARCQCYGPLFPSANFYFKCGRPTIVAWAFTGLLRMMGNPLCHVGGPAVPWPTTVTTSCATACSSLLMGWRLAYYNGK